MITIEDLQISYGERIVSHVDHLQVADGEIVGIAGESGSGKSQAALAILGLSRSRGAKVTGSVKLDGKELLSLSQRQWRTVRGKKIGFIMQSPKSAWNPTFRIGSIFESTLRMHGVERSEIRKRAEKSLNEVVLEPEILNRYPHQVSGGQAQRLAIALVAALGSQVIIADEPTSALDVTVQSEVIELLKNLRERHGTSMIFISHDLAVIGELADQVLVMKSGKVIEHGPTKRILVHPSQDYTLQLLEAVPRIGKGRIQ